MLESNRTREEIEVVLYEVFSQLMPIEEFDIAEEEFWRLLPQFNVNVAEMSDME